MHKKRPIAVVVASVFLAAGCASNGAPEPWACGVFGQLAGGALGGALGATQASEENKTGAAIGGALAGALIVGVGAWQVCEVFYARAEEREKAERQRRREERKRQREAEAARKAAAVPPPPPPPPATPDAPEIILGGPSFAFGSAALTAGAHDELDLVAESLRANKDVRVQIDGYTDSVGDDAANAAVSQRRADAVRDYLIERGIDANRLEARGSGESNPLATNDTPEGRAANRRVELDLIHADEEAGQ